MFINRGCHKGRKTIYKLITEECLVWHFCLKVLKHLNQDKSYNVLIQLVRMILILHVEKPKH